MNYESDKVNLHTIYLYIGQLKIRAPPLSLELLGNIDDEILKLESTLIIAPFEFYEKVQFEIWMFD